MEIVSSGWSNRHKELSQNIRKTEAFERVLEMILQLHQELHTSIVSKSKDINPIDVLFNDLQHPEYSIMPTQKDETIAWAVWHIARIEDLTMNILVNHGSQVFDATWQSKMSVDRTDTGNAMSDKEMLEFSKQICSEELLIYRDTVGIRSREIIRNLKPADMKRKVTPDDIARILLEGGVTEQEDSIWLLDFWGKKDVAGIILMPLTRHQTLHLNDCDKWKKSIRKKSNR